MTGGEKPEQRIWERGWDGHSLAQQRRLASLPFADKLEWLEHAHQVVRHLREPGTGGASAERSSVTGSSQQT